MSAHHPIDQGPLRDAFGVAWRMALLVLIVAAAVWLLACARRRPVTAPPAAAPAAPVERPFSFVPPLTEDGEPCPGGRCRIPGVSR